jgi:hypothetical protein
LTSLREEAEDLAHMVQKYVDASRRVVGRRQSTTRGSITRRDPSQTRHIKAWLEEKGIDYPKRGRLPQNLVERWEAAHKS